MGAKIFTVEDFMVFPRQLLANIEMLSDKSHQVVRPTAISPCARGHLNVETASPFTKIEMCFFESVDIGKVLPSGNLIAEVNNLRNVRITRSNQK